MTISRTSANAGSSQAPSPAEATFERDEWRLLCRIHDLGPDELARRALRVSFAERYAQFAETQALMKLGGDARFDFEWFDCLCGTLLLNVHASGPTNDTARLLGLGSFVNHAEDPNAQMIDPNSASGLGGVHMDASISLERKHTGFVATRDIEAGEEITCSYPHPSALPEERAAVLRQFLLDEGG